MIKVRLLTTLSIAAGAIVLVACGGSTDSDTAASSNPGTGGASSSGPSNGGSGTAGSKNVGGGGTGGNGNGGGGAGGGVQKGLSKVGTGEYETFYLVDGTIYAYGGSAGTLGLGSYQGLSIPPRAIDTPAGLKFLDVQGGLHQSMAIDENHKVWTWGDTNNGLQGSGMSNTDATVPYQITVDADGNPFDHIVGIEPATPFNSALKDDGSVWMWGDCSYVMPGPDAKNYITKPTKVALPDGVKIKQIIAGAVSLLALATDGTVWIWGESEDKGSLGTGKADSSTPTQVVGLPKNIKQVSAGYSDFYYALTDDGELYGWGYRWLYIGMYDPTDPNHSYWPQHSPVALKSWLKLPLPVEQVACDQMTTHVILSDGSLWGWGDNPQGEVGNGQELDFSKTCGWDFSTDLWVYHPVQIAKEAGKFKQIFSNSAYDFYTYAMTVDDKLYSWGRNKTGTLGNGVYPLAADGNSGVSSDMCATYPNSWDVTTPTLVDPMHVTPKGVNSPCCVANPEGKDCGM